MNFTCTGKVIQWRATGVFTTPPDSQNYIDAMLDIWREISANPGTYRRMGRIQLGTCGNASFVIGRSIIIECTLSQDKRVTVEPGDVIGIEIADNNVYRFRLYFITGGGPTNYYFSGHFESTATLSQAIHRKQVQPQVSLTIEPIMSASTAQPVSTKVSTIDVPITQLSITTEASSTPTSSSVTTKESPNIQETIIDSSATESLTTMTDLANPRQSTSDVVGAIVGGVVGFILLSALILVMLALVFQSRKYRRDLRDRESRNVNNMEVKANDSYIPVFRQISTENNVAYGEMVNQTDNMYEIVDPPYIKY